MLKLNAILVMILITQLGLAGLAGGQDVSEQSNPWLWVSIGKVKVKAETVKTPERLYLGLSYRRELPEGQGMLFMMPEISWQTFCMRGMRFPLDFLWIAADRVVGITRNVSPTFRGELTSPEPVKYVLEVPGGFADRNGIRVGDLVKWLGQ
jgi:uncharacterized protein